MRSVRPPSQPKGLYELDTGPDIQVHPSSSSWENGPSKKTFRFLESSSWAKDNSFLGTNLQVGNYLCQHSRFSTACWVNILSSANCRHSYWTHMVKVQHANHSRKLQFIGCELFYGDHRHLPVATKSTSWHGAARNSRGLVFFLFSLFSMQCQCSFNRVVIRFIEKLFLLFYGHTL